MQLRGERGERESFEKNALEQNHQMFSHKGSKSDLIFKFYIWNFEKKIGINLCDFGVHGQGYKICRFSLLYVTDRDKKKQITNIHKQTQDGKKIRMSYRKSDVQSNSVISNSTGPTVHQLHVRKIPLKKQYNMAHSICTTTNI
jgi:hypothetical protein